MHTTVHAPRTKDHVLIFGPKNQHVIILNGHDPYRAPDIETLTCMCAAENEERLEPKDIGGDDLELARWSSHLAVWNGTQAVLRSQIQTVMFTCELRGW